MEKEKEHQDAQVTILNSSLLKYVAWPVPAHTGDPTKNHTVDLCYMATALYTDSDVNTSKPFLPQEEDRFKQLENKTQKENSFVIRNYKD